MNGPWVGSRIEFRSFSDQSLCLLPSLKVSQEMAVKAENIFQNIHGVGEKCRKVVLRVSVMGASAVGYLVGLHFVA